MLCTLMVTTFLLGCASDRSTRNYRFGYGDNIFTDNGLFIPSTYETFEETDFRVTRYCRGFKKAAYFGETQTFGQPLGLFITRVIPRDEGYCTIFGFFSKTASSYPLQIYPFKAEFNGTEAVASTNNFHGVGSVDRIFHTMKVDGYRLVYQGRAYTNFGGGDVIISAVLYETRDLKNYVPAVEAQLENSLVEDLQSQN